MFYQSRENKIQDLISFNAKGNFSSNRDTPIIKHNDIPPPKIEDQEENNEAEEFESEDKGQVEE